MRKTLFVLLAVAFVGLPAAAKDYYVAVTAVSAGNGTSPADAANIAGLKTFLSTYNKATDANLHVFFAAGTYTIPAGGLSFNATAANISGLTVTFAPLNGGTVILEGATSGTYLNKLLTMPASSAGNPLTVTIKDVIIRNFNSTTTADEDGNTSLFTVRRYNILNLKSDSINNISSRRNPFVALGQDATLNVDSSKIYNIIKDGTSAYAIFETAGTNSTLNFTASVLSDWGHSSNSGNTWANMFYLEDANSTLTMRGCTVKNCHPQMSLISCVSATNSTITVENTTFYNNSSPVNGDVSGLFDIDDGMASFTDCRFTENRINTGNSTYGRMFYIHSNHQVTITGSTFSGNTISGSNSRIIYHYDIGDLTVANNTFSNNTGMSAAIRLYELNTSGNKAGVINNTFYNSGDIELSVSSNAVVRNNLFVTTGGITGTTGAIARNIFNNSFYETGISSGAPLDSATALYVEDFLSGEEGKPQVHALKMSKGTIPILKSGGTAAATGYASFLLTDQRGVPRPAKISVGAYDRREHVMADTTYVIYYNPDIGLLAPYTEDMKQYVRDSTGMGAPAHFVIIAQPDVIGTVEQNPADSSEFLIYPRVKQGSAPPQPDIGTVGKPSELTYEVTIGDIVKTGKLTVSIVNTGLPSGLLDESMLRCYGTMGTELFDANYKYISRNVNGKEKRYDGFSVPLVGDLNGDGKPEIVVLAIDYLNSSDGTGLELFLEADATDIVILNGQTGEEIVRHPVPFQWDFRAVPTHSTPSWMALVDADRNGQAEIILACGRHPTASHAYSKRLVSYKITVNSATKAITGLAEKWVSNATYAESSTESATKSSPLLQVVDFNPDGTPASSPEILVYNKIFDAQTGQLKVELQTLQPTPDWNARNAAISSYHDFAYTGRNRNTRFYDNAIPGDRNIAFPSVYDLDGDGNMEVIAGGKVYYDINPANGSYSVKSADAAVFNLGIGDGYTGVADVDGDGIADIVVVAFDDDGGVVQLGYGTGSMRIKVWDPGFLTVQNDTIVGVTDKANHPPTLKASASVPLSFIYRQGSHSYVYIGDIDGKVQEKNGKQYKLPEISVLGPRFYINGSYTDNTPSIPFHPNVGSPTFGNYTTNGIGVLADNTARGALMCWTWDVNETDPAQKLKVSFAMEHADFSLNTGFTFFDFDNDGIQEICYRDEFFLRIISASQPVVKLGETSPSVVRFRRNVSSYTGFEYPVVADIDGDSSADLVVMGSLNFLPNGVQVENDARGYVYALQANPATTRFAPAPKVWNQFMYSPLKINEDLTTPIRNFHPLAPEYEFTKKSDVDMGLGTKTRIYNNTITQVVKSAVIDGVLQPVIPFPDADLFNVSIDTAQLKLRFSIRNLGEATLNADTKIRIFRGSADYIPCGYVDAMKVGVDLFMNETAHYEYALSGLTDPLLYNYTIRVADSTSNCPPDDCPDCSNCTNCPDLFTEYYADCNWANNVAELGLFVLRDDAYTVVQRRTVMLDILDNDSIPESCLSSLQLTSAMITTPDGTGVMSGDFGVFTLVGNRLKYTAPLTYTPGVVTLTYRITCNGVVRQASIYIYIVESCYDTFVACRGIPYTLCLREHPPEVEFEWFEREQDIYPLPVSLIPPHIADPDQDVSFWVKPKVSTYPAVDFPRAEIRINILKTGRLFLLPNKD